MADKEQFMSMVIDPSDAADEVSLPAVHWSGAEPQGNESWQGELTDDATVPQVELRRTLDNGASVVVRLNIGNQAVNSKGDEVAAGVVLTTNKAIVFSWREYWGMLAAVEEGIARLMGEQEEIYAQLGQRWAGSGSEVVGAVPE